MRPDWIPTYKIVSADGFVQRWALAKDGSWYLAHAYRKEP